MSQPRTLHSPHIEDGGRPCVHFGDRRDHTLQVHHDDEAPGMVFTAAAVHPVFGLIVVGVALTPGQVHELLTHLREEA